MNILVTGATGFIGRNLIEELSKHKGYTIFCLVRHSSNIEPLKFYRVKFIYADITLKDTLDKITQKFDVIFHCAALVDDKNEEELYKVNVLGTENICQLAQRLKSGRLVYLSTVAVVSGNPQIPLVEDLPYKATNLYGQSKVEAEKIVVAYRKAGLPVVILRPCMVYGEEEPHMLKSILTLLNKKLLPLINGGRNEWHLVYVKNVVAAMIFALKNDAFLEGSFFVADEEVLTTKEVMNTMACAIGSKPPWELPQSLTFFLRHTPFIGKKVNFLTKNRVYSIERIKALGFNPPYSARVSLKKSAHYRLNS